VPDIERIQRELKAEGVDGWLIYDFRNSDPIAHAIIGLDFGGFSTRRWFYWIPQRGTGALSRLSSPRNSTRSQEKRCTCLA
jgi:hypothetical protein